jgi:deoxyribonuclease V
MAVGAVLAHPWDVSPAEARDIQRQLRRRMGGLGVAAPKMDVFSGTSPTACGGVFQQRWPKVVAGIDVSVKGGRARAAVVLCSYPTLRSLHATTVDMPVSFPYVPGLLAFREGPVALAALEKLGERPDVLIFDAQGLAHPRRMGLATHLGILLDMPAVGCAKSRLCGTHAEPDEPKGSWVPLMDGDQVIGAVVRTRDSVRPVFVSVGYRMDLETAISLVLGCVTRYRLPEPIRWAHRVAGGGSLPLPG